MASATVPNTIQCDIVYLLFGQRVENVIHVQVPGGVDAAVLVDTANEIGSWVETWLLGLLSDDLQFLQVEAKNLSIVDGGMAVYTPSTPKFGGSTASAEPGNVSYCVSFRTARTGRSYRGRFYLAGIPSIARTGNTLSSGYVSDVLAAFAQLLSILTALEKVLVVVSRIQDHITLSVGVATPVEAVTVTDLYIDSQRRRLTGRGT